MRGRGKPHKDRPSLSNWVTKSGVSGTTINRVDVPAGIPGGPSLGLDYQPRRFRDYVKPAPVPSLVYQNWDFLWIECHLTFVNSCEII